MIVGPSEFGYVFWFQNSLFATDGMLFGWDGALTEIRGGATYLNDEISSFFYNSIDSERDKVAIPGTDFFTFIGPQGFAVAPLTGNHLSSTNNRKRFKVLVRNNKVPPLLQDLAWTRICRRIVLHGIPKIQRNIESECRALSRETGIPHRRVHTIRNAARQLRATIAVGDILAPTWEPSPSASWQKVHVQLRRQLSIQEASLQANSLRLDMDGSESCVLMASGDLDAVLSNLVSNVVKYSLIGSQVRISFDEDTSDGGLRVNISTMSLAISPDEVPWLTRIGYRGQFARHHHSAKAGTGESTGLGLSIVSRVLTAYGAKLEIEPGPSQRNGYAPNRFAVLFPARMCRHPS